MTDTAARPRIDPRFARRWVEVQRANGRRRLRMLLAGAAALVLLAMVAGSFYTPLWKVRHVRVQVAGPISAARVRSLAGLDGQHLMVNLDTARVAARLDAIPVLGGARVTKRWPGTVNITVHARPVLAQIADGSSWVTVDATGRVLFKAGSQLPAIPVLKIGSAIPAVGSWLAASLGPAVVPGTPASRSLDLGAASGSPTSPNPTEAALAIIATLPAPLRPEVIDATITASGSVSLQVLPPNFETGTITVNMGDGSLVADKVSALATLVTQTDLSNVTEIDLSVPSRPALLTAR